MKTHTSQKTKKKVYEFDERSLNGAYFVYPDCSFYELCQQIKFSGFPTLPKGFSRDGYGFASPAGTFLTDGLTNLFGKGIGLHIAKTKHTEARRSGTKWQVTLNHADYLRVLDPLRDIRRERNLKSNAHVAHVLGEIFPKQAKKTKEVPSIYSYEENKISKILGSAGDVFKKLSKADIEAIAGVYSQIAEESKADFSSISIAEESKRRNERVYLQTVVDEFEKRLSNKVLSESDWQRFLQRYILLFNTSYVSSIEKLSVDLRGKYPDFMLANVYGYLDIYEIKKPTTNLLKHDDGRDNYYWDAEIARAIIQTEKYIQMLIKQGLEVRDFIKEKYGVDVKVIRPRGFIVAGKSDQFENTKMNDDFRLLASALKNVDIVLYDELLGNLKNLLSRLKGRPKRRTPAKAA